MRAMITIRVTMIITKNWHFQDTWEPPRRRYNDEDEGEDDDEIEDEVDRDAEEEGGDTADITWDKDAEEGNEVSPEDGLQDLQYFPNFYRLLRSLDSGKNTHAGGRCDILDHRLTARYKFFRSRTGPESCCLFCSPSFPPHILLLIQEVHMTHTRTTNCL